MSSVKVNPLFRQLVNSILIHSISIHSFAYLDCVIGHFENMRNILETTAV